MTISRGSRCDRCSDEEGTERGASIIEYALLTVLLVMAGLGAFTYLTRESSEFLVETGSTISEPRAHIVDIP